MKNDIVLREVCKFMIPAIQLYAVYIILHGHISPGGGFAGGTILSCSFIIAHLVFGRDYVKSKFNFNLLIKIMSICLIIYGIIKMYSFLTSGTHLPHPPLGVPGNILSGGFILPLNILVGIIVACVMYIVFDLFMEGGK